MSAGPLHRPAFRRLTIAWAFSNFGDSALFLSLAIWTKDLTGSDSSAGLVFLFLGLPAFLAPVAGHLADRFPRRRLVVVANLVAAGGVTTLALVDSSRDVWLIYVVTFGYGLLAYVTSACASGLLRDLLPDDELAGANGLLQTIDQGLRLLSPLAGAGLYAAFGGTAIAALTATMLAIAAAVVLTVRMTESGPTPHEDRDTFWLEFTAGLRHIRRTAGLARPTAMLAIAVGITGLSNTAIFAAIDQGLHRSSEFFGVIASAQGAGAVAGGVTSAIVVRRMSERPTLGVGLLVVAAGIATLIVASEPVVLAGAFVVGVGIPWCFVSFATMRQRLTPPALQGRVAAATNLAFNGPQTFGTALGAAIIGVVDYRALVATMAVVIGACALGVSAATTAEEATEQVAEATATAAAAAPTEHAAEQVAETAAT